MLKIIHDNKVYDGNEKLMTELSNFPECQKLFNLMNKDYTSQAHFITETLTHYDFSRICQNEIDWKNTPKSQITKARNNYAVIGDWQAKYSNFKDLLIKKEESSIGYNDEEIGEIKEMTKGYSTWKKLTN